MKKYRYNRLVVKWFQELFSIGFNGVPMFNAKNIRALETKLRIAECKLPAKNFRGFWLVALSGAQARYCKMVSNGYKFCDTCSCAKYCQATFGFIIRWFMPHAISTFFAEAMNSQLPGPTSPSTIKNIDAMLKSVGGVGIHEFIDNAIEVNGQKLRIKNVISSSTIEVE